MDRLPTELILKIHRIVLLEKVRDVLSKHLIRKTKAKRHTNTCVWAKLRVSEHKHVELVRQYEYVAEDCYEYVVVRELCVKLKLRVHGDRVFVMLCPSIQCSWASTSSAGMFLS